MTVLMPYISLHLPFLVCFCLQVMNYRVGFFQKHDSSLQIASTSRIILELKENLFTPPVNHSKPVNFCFSSFSDVHIGVCIHVCEL